MERVLGQSRFSSRVARRNLYTKAIKLQFHELRGRQLHLLEVQVECLPAERHKNM